MKKLICLLLTVSVLFSFASCSPNNFIKDHTNNQMQKNLEKEFGKNDAKKSGNAIIFADSYSTFKDFIPFGYLTYYSEENENQTNVTKVSDTWWHQVMTEKNLNLVLNDSWSGSTIAYTGYDNYDCSESSSFIYRLKQLEESGFFDKNEIDTVFVFGGTNDSVVNSSLGELKYDNFEKSDLYSVIPAICYFFKTLKSILPDAKIYCLVNNEINYKITNAFTSVCDKYDITEVTFKKIDKIKGHPTAKGMQDIKNEVLKAMEN